MMKSEKRMSSDVVVIGSGPGGATVARELAGLGKDVILLERGADHQFYGNTLGAAMMFEKFGLTRSLEGNSMLRAMTTGGSSMLFCAAAIDPPKWLKEKYSIDLGPYVERIKQEIGIRPTPESRIGPRARMMMKAAHDLNIPWEPMDKFIDHERCDQKCPECVFGCKKGAKWTARSYAYEAVKMGARLINRAKVETVVVKNDKAVGVIARTPQGEIHIESKVTVVAAGGLGTPAILKRSGIEDAGDRFFADPLIITYGEITTDVADAPKEPPMLCGKLDNEADGILIGDLNEPLPMFTLQMYYNGIAAMRHILNFSRRLGVMVKIRDEMQGYVLANEKFSKVYTAADQEKIRLGIEISNRILKQAGCKTHNIVSTPPRAAHPGGSARIGAIVDRDLETRIRNLYVCDASVIPEPCGLPPVLTLLGFGKRLVDQRLRHMV